MSQEFTTFVSNVSSDPFTWNLEVEWEGSPGEDEQIALRNSQSEYLHNVPIEEIHIMHLHLDPDGVLGEIMGLCVMWKKGEFAKVMESAPLSEYKVKDGKRVREITYYCDKDAVEFVYYPPHPLEPQPPNTVHNAEGYRDLITGLRDFIADRWDEETRMIEDDKKEILFD